MKSFFKYLATLSLLVLCGSIFSLVFSRDAHGLPCTAAYNCIPGHWSNTAGGSLVQGSTFASYDYATDSVSSYIQLQVVSFKHYAPGCYMDVKGEGYWTYPAQINFRSIDSGHSFSVGYSGARPVKLPPQMWGTTWAWFPSVPGDRFYRGQRYVATASYNRRHICSVENDAPVYASSFEVVIPTRWQLQGKTYLEGKQGVNAKTITRPNTQLSFNHTVTNIASSGNYMDRDSRAEVWQRLMDKNNNQIGDWERPPRLTNQIRLNSGQSKSYTNSTTVLQAHVGKKICQSIWAIPGAWNNSGYIASGDACAYVPYHYPDCIGSTCKPGDDTPPKHPCFFYGNCDDTNRKTSSGGVRVATSANVSEVEPGGKVQFTYTVSNKSGPTKSKDLNVAPHTFLLKRESSIPKSANQGSMVAYPISSGNGGWGNVWCGARGLSFNLFRNNVCTSPGSYPVKSLNPGSSSSSQKDYTIEGNWSGEPGDQICSYLAIDNRWNVYNDEDAKTYAASNIACVKIGKKPQIQVNGSDSYAAKGFEGSTHQGLTAKNRGSYSQYGLLTKDGSINNFGSSGLTIASGNNRFNSLYFANRKLNGMGGLTHTNLNFNIPAATTVSSGSLSGLKSGVYRSNGNLRIDTTALTSGTRLVIYVNGTVTINGNIDYAAANNAANIPSLTVIASGNINVNSNVTKISGIYASTNGAFQTCIQANSAVSSATSVGGTCNNKLRIDGAIYSKKSPIMRRTFGAGNQTNQTNQFNPTNANTTTEWFNYTPNTWLSAHLNGDLNNINGFNTTNSSGLPTRY